MQIEKLTEAEEVVMKGVWNCQNNHPPILSEIVEEVSNKYKKQWKSQTVSTFLAKLVRKGYLRLHREGKTYTYEVLVSEKIYNREQLRRIHNFLYAGNKVAMQSDLESL